MGPRPSSPPPQPVALLFSYSVATQARSPGGGCVSSPTARHVDSTATRPDFHQTMSTQLTQPSKQLFLLHVAETSHSRGLCPAAPHQAAFSCTVYVKRGPDTLGPQRPVAPQRQSRLHNSLPGFYKEQTTVPAGVHKITGAGWLGGDSTPFSLPDASLVSLPDAQLVFPASLIDTHCPSLRVRLFQNHKYSDQLLAPE